MIKDLDDLIEELEEKIGKLELLLEEEQDIGIEVEIEELTEKKNEYEQMRNKQWKAENDELERQYWATQF